jgi:enterochelin esterase-like enzyme
MHVGRTVIVGLGLVMLLGPARDGTAQAPPPTPPSPPAPPAAAPPMPPRIVSPEVHADRTVTFRLRAPTAREVGLGLEGTTGKQPMKKDDQGVWSVTTTPLEPDYYGYSFEVDGTGMLDPSNPVRVPNLLSNSSSVHVPGPALPWETSEVPRGTVHHHFYRSGVVGDDRDFYVYTPPGYDPAAARTYPVLYLLHGFSDDASAWTAVGRAHVILDNLIAQGRAKPMLMVNTLGYGAPEIVDRGFGAFRDVGLRQRNYERFRDALLTEVIPQVERTYRVKADRESRALAGLSMGGAETLFVGLNALDRFAFLGAFSSGGLPEEFDATFPGLDAAANAKLRLLWIACGTEDRLIALNRQFHGWLDGKGVKHTMVETPGAHTWMVWRRNLATLAPLLF